MKRLPMLQIQDFSETLVASLPFEVQELLFFHVGDIFLYFDVIQCPNGRLRALVAYNDGPGFILEKAIKRHHESLLQWLLQEYNFPKDYLLASAANYGDVKTLQYITSLMGEDYKKYDIPAKLFCIAEGKMSQLEYLYQRNPTFKSMCEYVSWYIVIGMYNSQEICSWYVKNKPTTYEISEVDLIRGYLQNNDTTGASEQIDSSDLSSLMKALSAIRSGNEATFRWLIATYPDEDVLVFVADACARIGYPDTLEILFNEPYNVHVEYGFFEAIANLAVAQVLHKYAYKRNSISRLLYKGVLRKGKPRFKYYCTPNNYSMLLKKFTQSYESSERRTFSHFLARPSEDVLMFLMDLADVTSNVEELNTYVKYAIEHGHLGVLQKLRPHMREEDVSTLARQIEARLVNVYSSSSPAMVEYLLEWGMTQKQDVDLLIPKFELKFIQKLVERGLATDCHHNLFEWNSQTQDTLQKLMLRSIGGGFMPNHFENTATFLEMARSSYVGFYEQNSFDNIEICNSQVTFSTDHLMRYRTYRVTSLSKQTCTLDKIVRMIKQNLTAVHIHLLLHELNNRVKCK
ncbi:hypothetical protein K7432_010359 [Basidiobolus ranarum]|uniref:Ankyrin repeat-containing protein n=1 Tax=Basidiobolus ranarum TaxID=34480 RepID=A0ABR2VVL4_9FUNG